MSKRRGDYSTRDSSETSTSKRAFSGRCLACSAPLPPKRPAAQQQQQPRKKNLHLVLNDWDRGYSIYRAGEDAFVSSDADADADAPRPAAASLLVRIVAQHANSRSFAAHGAKILAMYPAESSPGIPAFDTDALAMTVCPSPMSRGVFGTKPLYACAGGRLWAFVYPYLEVLGPEPPATEESWAWASVESMPPFDSFRVSCYAVHPDGRTIFVSVRGYKLNPGLTLPNRGDLCSTFAFDVETLEWTHVGDWTLPFRGQAYYDHELDAWVGLCIHEEGTGHVCCSDVPPATTGGCATMPAWKLGVEVFFDTSSERHLGATLVYMDNSRFCLVESRMPKDDDFYPRLRVAKMTSFALKYGKEGELRVAGRCAHASMDYQVPHEHNDRSLDPVAFWV